jgi:hypothetical protein
VSSPRVIIQSGWDGADRRSSSGPPSPLRSPAACLLRVYGSVHPDSRPKGQSGALVDTRESSSFRLTMLFMCTIPGSDQCIVLQTDTCARRLRRRRALACRAASPTRHVSTLWASIPHGAGHREPGDLRVSVLPSGPAAPNSSAVYNGRLFSCPHSSATLPPPPSEEPTMTRKQELRARILELWGLGVSAKHISEILHVQWKTVFKHLQEANAVEAPQK